MTTAERRRLILAEVALSDMRDRETDATNRATIGNAIAITEAAIDSGRWPGHVYGDGSTPRRLRSGKRI